MTGAMDRKIITLNAEAELQLYGLPTNVERLIRDVAAAYQAPVEFPTAMALACMSVAIGSHARAHWAGYTSWPNVWPLIVAPTGKNKSESCKPLLEPIKKIDLQLNREYEAAFRQAQEEAKSKKNKSGEIIMPPTKQIILQDTTREARTAALASNPHGILFYQPEWSQYILDMARYTKGRGEQYEMINIFDVTPLKVNRKGEPMLTIERPYMVTMGGVQSDMLSTIFAHQGFIASGFLPRFLIFYPTVFGVKDYHNMRPPDPALMSEWDSFLSHIYATALDFDIAIERDAEHFYSDFCNSTEMIAWTSTREECAFLAKLRVNVLRLSCLAAVANSHADGMENMGARVTLREMSWAIDCAWYFYDCSRRMIIGIKGENKLPTLPETIASLCALCPDLNKTKLAEAIGKDRKTIYRSLTK